MFNQRWRSHRSYYRHADEVINTREYEVAPMTGDSEAKAFVEKEHYSKSYVAARFRFGLWNHGLLAGVAVFSHPCNDSALTNVFKCPALMAVELGRFVLRDSVPGNGETWFLARCFEHLRKSTDLIGVLSFSDPIPRRKTTGEVVMPGHIGTIYQAHNGRYLGLSTPRTVLLLPDGSVLSARAVQKIRALESGWKYASAILQRFGAAPLTGDPVAWLGTWLPRLTRKVRHPGAHKYAWPLRRSAEKILPSALAYPKFQPLFCAHQRTESPWSFGASV